MTGPSLPEIVDAAEFDQLFEECSNWGRWGSADRLGTVNLITRQVVASAAQLVEIGETVSCSRSVATEPSIDNPEPAEHRMTRLPSEAQDGVGAAFDFLGVACHGEVQSHIDALCHISYRDKLYNGVAASTVTTRGAAEADLDTISGGIVSRGILLDLAELRGKCWLEPGELITGADLDAATRAVGVEPRGGDVVLLRTGQAGRRSAQGPWDSANEKAGLHPRAMPWFKEMQIAALGFDGDGDSAPDPCPSVPAPIHVLGINAMGLHTFDALDLEKLAARCAHHGRWEFFFVALPIRLEGGTGCLINPIAIF